MNVNVVNDDVVHELKREASTSRNVNIVATAVDGLVTVHDELFLQSNVHVAAEDDPKRLASNDSIAKSPFFWVNDIVITVICDNIYLSVLTTDGILAKAKSAVSQRLPVVGPV